MAGHSNRSSLVESLLPAALQGSGIAARVDDTWLRLVGRPRGDTFSAAADLWPVLGRNVRMAGSIRFGLPPGSRRLLLCADLSTEGGEDGEIEASVIQLCRDFRRQASLISVNGSEEHEPIGRDAASRIGTNNVTELCAESGWPAATRAAGDTVVTLDAGPVSYAARLESCGDAGLNIVVDLFDAEAYAADSRAAAAQVLLAASVFVRSVKGVVRLHAGREVCALASTVAEPLSAGALGRAFSELTVACQLVGRETQALRHAGLARDYLAFTRVNQQSPLSISA